MLQLISDSALSYNIDKIELRDGYRVVSGLLDPTVQQGGEQLRLIFVQYRHFYKTTIGLEQ